jgi:NitT/TauT family transport system permease protein
VGGFKPTVLALIVPLLLLAFWQVATTRQWTRLIPTPAAVAEYMVDFAWAASTTMPTPRTLPHHLLASMSRVYGGFALAAIFALPIGILIGRNADRPHAARPVPAGDAADPGHGLAAAVDDPVRPRRQVGLRPGLPRRLLPHPAEHGVRRALVDPKLFEAASMLGCSRQRPVLQGGAARRDPSIFTGLRLGSASPGSSSSSAR